MSTWEGRVLRGVLVRAGFVVRGFGYTIRSDTDQWAKYLAFRNMRGGLITRCDNRIYEPPRVGRSRENRHAARVQREGRPCVRKADVEAAGTSYGSPRRKQVNNARNFAALRKSRQGLISTDLSREKERTVRDFVRRGGDNKHGAAGACYFQRSPERESWYYSTEQTLALGAAIPLATAMLLAL